MKHLLLILLLLTSCSRMIEKNKIDSDFQKKIAFVEGLKVGSNIMINHNGEMRKFCVMEIWKEQKIMKIEGGVGLYHMTLTYTELANILAGDW